MDILMHTLGHAVEHAFEDTIKLVPFLFLTYLAMEALEHKAGDKAERAVRKAGSAGPVVGALLGIVPQCGFSAAAATFYAGRVITVGTLIAVFLSTSDEMLPLFIAARVPVVTMASILAIKFFIALLAGFSIDFALRKLRRGGDGKMHIHDLCEQEHCACCEHKSILLSALRHTLQVTFFIFLVTLVLGIAIESFGEDSLAQFMSASPMLSVVASALVGFIPNCAASVAITQLYLEGALGLGALIAGLLTNAGVGLLVLFRTSRPMVKNFQIVGILLAVALASGFAISALGISL